MCVYENPYLIVSIWGAWRNERGWVMFFRSEAAAQELCDILNKGSKDDTVYTVGLRYGAHNNGRMKVQA